MPISGGAFVNQLAGVINLTEIGYRPDCIFASSGGNVAAYISVAAEWHWASIERITREVNNKMFARPWNSLTPIAFIQAYNKGYMYNSGTGVDEFYNFHFTPTSITSCEIWTGTQEVESQRAAIFCNRAYTCLNFTDYDNKLYNVCRPIYCNGDITMLAKVSVASASIPSIVPPVTINGNNYVDGGVCSGSPMTSLYPTVIKTCSNIQPCHITYITPFNLYKPAESNFGNLVSNSRQAARDIVRSQVCTDRACAYAVIANCSNNLKHQHFYVNNETLIDIFQLVETYNYTMCEFYPLESLEVDILNFTGNEAVELINQITGNMACNVWYGM